MNRMVSFVIGLLAMLCMPVAAQALATPQQALRGTEAQTGLLPVHVDGADGRILLELPPADADGIAELSEELMDKYLEEGDLSEEDIIAGIRAQTVANNVVGVFCGTAFKNKGVQTLLDAVVQFMPSPVEVPPIRGVLENEE